MRKMFSQKQIEEMINIKASEIANDKIKKFDTSSINIHTWTSQDDVEEFINFDIYVFSAEDSESDVEFHSPQLLTCWGSPQEFFGALSQPEDRKISIEAGTYIVFQFVNGTLIQTNFEI